MFRLKQTPCATKHSNCYPYLQLCILDVRVKMYSSSSIVDNYSETHQLFKKQKSWEWSNAVLCISASPRPDQSEYWWFQRFSAALWVPVHSVYPPRHKSFPAIPQGRPPKWHFVFLFYDQPLVWVVSQCRIPMSYTPRKIINALKWPQTHFSVGSGCFQTFGFSILVNFQNRF